MAEIYHELIADERVVVLGDTPESEPLAPLLSDTDHAAIYADLDLG